MQQNSNYLLFVLVKVSLTFSTHSKGMHKKINKPILTLIPGSWKLGQVNSSLSTGN